MAMEFKRRLPIPMEIREEMPLSAELTAKKQAFDAEVAKVFTGEDARKVLIIGPCSADREDSVLEYMNRLAKTAEEVKAASERDHWMTAEEAKDFGLVDKIITAKK